MLKKFKYPSKYVNHGVWVILNDRYDIPVKKKIVSVDVHFGTINGPEDWIITNVYLHDIGWVKPENIFMSMREATQYNKEKIKELKKKELNDINSEISKIQRDIEFNERAIESKTHYLNRLKDDARRVCSQIYSKNE